MKPVFFFIILLTSACSPQPIKKTVPLPGSCPIKEPTTTADYPIAATEEKVNLPNASFTATPNIVVATSDKQEEVQLSANNTLTFLDFDNGLQDAFFSAGETLEFVQGQPGSFKAGACVGTSRFDWQFNALADKAVLTKVPDKLFTITYELKFTKDNTDFSVSGTLEPK